jgi:hypothetical protein
MRSFVATAAPLSWPITIPNDLIVVEAVITSFGPVRGGAGTAEHASWPEHMRPALAANGETQSDASAVGGPKARKSPALIGLIRWNRTTVTSDFPRRFLINLASPAQDRNLPAYPAHACFIGGRIWMTGSVRIWRIPPLNPSAQA